MVLWLGFGRTENQGNADDESKLNSKQKHKKSHDKKIKKKDRQDTEYHSKKNPTVDEELELVKLLTSKRRKDKNSISIRQFRCEISDVEAPQNIITSIEQNNISYPVRLRRAKDILRPIDLSENDLVASTPEDIIMICKRLVSEYNIQDDLVVQQLPEDKQEYILSCTDGVIDKMYLIRSDLQKRPVVENVSLKNLSLDNKKYLRKILYLQHKKIGRTKGTFDIGFFCSHPSIEFEVSGKDEEDRSKNNIKIVGISVGPAPVPIIQGSEQGSEQRSDKDLDPQSDPRTWMMSYPYIEAK